MLVYEFDAMNGDAEEVQIRVFAINEDMAWREAIRLKRTGRIADVDLGSCRLDEYENDWLLY